SRARIVQRVNFILYSEGQFRGLLALVGAFIAAHPLAEAKLFEPAGCQLIHAAREAREDLLYRVAADGAGGEGVVGHLLEDFEGLFAGVADFGCVPVLVDWHGVSTFLTRDQDT